jgi:mRNA-degrading endonuclease toxin of MazEF toxin-antitoxin module
VRPERGKIWRVDTPRIPEDPHTARFGLIISVNRRNYKKDDFLVVPIFSEGEEGPTRVLLPEGDGGIHHDSGFFATKSPAYLNTLS